MITNYTHITTVEIRISINNYVAEKNRYGYLSMPAQISVSK